MHEVRDMLRSLAFVGLCVVAALSFADETKAAAARGISVELKASEAPGAPPSASCFLMMM